MAGRLRTTAALLAGLLLLGGCSAAATSSAGTPAGTAGATAGATPTAVRPAAVEDAVEETVGTDLPGVEVPGVEELLQGLDLYELYGRCRDNIRDGHPCLSDTARNQYEELHGLLSDIKAELDELDRDMKASFNLILDKLNNAQLEADLRDLEQTTFPRVDLAVKGKQEFVACLGSLQAGSGQTCTLTDADGNNPRPFPVTGTADLFAVGGPFDHLVVKALVPFAGAHPLGPDGLLTEDAERTLNLTLDKMQALIVGGRGAAQIPFPGVLADNWTLWRGRLRAAEHGLDDGSYPAFYSAAAVNDENVMTRYFVNQQAVLFDAVTTVLHLGPPANQDPAKGADVVPDAYAEFHARALQGISGQEQWALPAQEAAYLFPVAGGPDPYTAPSTQGWVLVPSTLHFSGSDDDAAPTWTLLRLDRAVPGPTAQPPAGFQAPTWEQYSRVARGLQVRQIRYSALAAAYPDALPAAPDGHAWVRMGTAWKVGVKVNTSRGPDTAYVWVLDDSAYPHLPGSDADTGAINPLSAAVRGQVPGTSCVAPAKIWDYDGAPDLLSMWTFYVTNGLPHLGDLADPLVEVTDPWRVGGMKVPARDLHVRFSPTSAFPAYDLTNGSVEGAGPGLFVRCNDAGADLVTRGLAVTALTTAEEGATGPFKTLVLDQAGPYPTDS